MILNTHPTNRKEMVKAISELTELPSAYMGMPSAAFQIGPITVNRDGSIDCEDETMIEKYVEHLVGNFMSDALIFTNLPIVRDVISLCNGYDVGRMDMDQFGQLYDAIEAMTKDGITFEEVLDAIF